MSKFKITIELGNDAVQTETDVADLLRKIAEDLKNDYRCTFPNDEGTYPSDTIRDLNGNKVGKWEISE